MRRRDLLAVGAGALASPAVARAQARQVLRFVPRADLAVLDPVWTTTYQTRDHAFLVFDTLFGMDSAFRPVPQMVEGAGAEADGLLWTLRLRENLRFHDGEPVRARDCAASVRRWGRRDTFGQALLAAMDALEAPDDRTLRFRLRRPFPLLPDALGKVPSNPCVIMPERLAATDAFTQVTEMVGSGPYRFVAAERIAGARAVYERFEGYVPRADGPVEWTAGPKRAHFERVEWVIIPDAATASAALQRGEVDWWLGPETDLLPVLRRNRRVVVRQIDPTGYIGNLRLNHLHPPFNDPAVRRAVLSAVDQSDFMQAVAGSERDLWENGVGIFCPGTPMANDAGLEALTGPRDLNAARRAITAGYRGERVAMLGGVDIPIIRALTEVAADLFRRLGMQVDYQAVDWPTVVQRRARAEAPDQGGWSAFCTWFTGLDHLNPAVHAFLRGNGRQASPGWPDSPAVEELREAWLAAPNLAAQRRIAADLQLRALADTPYVPLGRTLNVSAHRADLEGVVTGIPVFWNVRRGA
jgi:peptide/nickel transport system substrate-binding protein